MAAAGRMRYHCDNFTLVLILIEATLKYYNDGERPNGDERGKNNLITIGTRLKINLMVLVGM
jgi:hypothetical protein